MVTAYRRPNTVESDNGYSTMTPPADDSEQASTTCLELNIIGRERYRPQISSGISSGILLPPPNRSRSPISSHATSSCISTSGDTSVCSEKLKNTCEIAQKFPTSNQIQQETIIPIGSERNKFIAPVQVHMVDSF